jgi:NitT/TauT family transport system ATP-binding protein
MTGWPRDRDSTIVAEAAFGEVTGRLWRLLRGESLKGIGATAASPATAPRPES